MTNVGATRSSLERDHYLQTPDTFIRAPLPGMKRATAIVHAAPVKGAGFVEYTAEMEQGGTLEPTTLQRFVYVLDGTVAAGDRRVAAGGYAYFPEHAVIVISAVTPSRVVVIEKSYVALNDEEPEFFAGSEHEIAPEVVMGDTAVEMRMLLPNTPAFDFAVNTMTFEPGATLSLVEMHVMEHGLLMLEGGGIYRLSDSWYPVAAGDFIYMAPFCPQWFGALGKSKAKYLLYKNWNRHPCFE